MRTNTKLEYCIEFTVLMINVVHGRGLTRNTKGNAVAKSHSGVQQPSSTTTTRMHTYLKILPLNSEWLASQQCGLTSTDSSSCTAIW
jgi:hypothetical protein